jgi:hypothetical protein
VGGHRFAANLVILPHGLYYGPVGADAALAAIGAYQRGAVVAARYRGRAGQPQEEQEAEWVRLLEDGSLPLGLRRAREFMIVKGLRSDRRPFVIMGGLL